MTTLEQDVLHQLRDNQEAALRALNADDMAAYRALAEQEARLMDTLKAIWKSRASR